MGTKNLYENGPSPFFFVFFILMGTRMVQIRIAKSVWAFRNKTTNGSGAQIRLHQRYKTANNGFRTRCNYYYIWPITLLELKYIITSARNAAAIAKGVVGLRSIVFDSREEIARWRQGPRCLRCLKLRMLGGLGGLMMTPRRSSGCGACIPELTTRRHRGRLLCLGSRAKASTLQERHRRFTSGSTFHMSFRGLFSLLATQQKWYHHLQQVVQSLIPHDYRQYWCTQQPACSTHTHTRTVTELFTYKVQLYSSLYLLFSSKFWYSTSRYQQEARALDIFVFLGFEAIAAFRSVALSLL